MEKIAFEGSAKNGKKIIKTLESLGATNFKYKLTGEIEGVLYFINSENHIDVGQKLPEDYTLKDINTYSLESQLPEKWCIKITKENYKDVYTWLDKNNQRDSSYIRLVNRDFNPNDSDYCNMFIHYPKTLNNYHQENSVKSGYREISYIQFKRYIMKEKLIGYNLIDPKYRESFLKLVKVGSTPGRELGLPSDMEREENIEYFKSIGLLDIWFVPVYGSKLKLPNIGEYEGEDLGDQVKYGCQTRNVEDIKQLHEAMIAMDVEQVQIEDTLISFSTISEIVNYFNNK